MRRRRERRRRIGPRLHNISRWWRPKWRSSIHRMTSGRSFRRMAASTSAVPSSSLVLPYPSLPPSVLSSSSANVSPVPRGIIITAITPLRKLIHLRLSSLTWCRSWQLPTHPSQSQHQSKRSSSICALVATENLKRIIPTKCPSAPNKLYLSINYL